MREGGRPEQVSMEFGAAICLCSTGQYTVGGDTCFKLKAYFSTGEQTLEPQCAYQFYSNVVWTERSKMRRLVYLV